MCQECCDAIAEEFPLASPDEASSILWNETPFPFGEASDIIRCLRDARYRRDNYLLTPARG